MRLLHGAGLALAILAAADAGDPEATDRRLQRAGAGTGLRLQALEAIARGSAYLERAQRADGTFLAPGVTSLYGGPETLPVDALCALALEQAGSPTAKAAAGRTLERLAPAADRIPDAVSRSVLASSFLARLAVERRADPALAAALAAGLARTQDESGLWKPRRHRLEPGFGTLLSPPDVKYIPDMETAHAAILGLAAAESGEGRAPTGAWTRHLEALHRLQGADGGFRFQIAAASVSDVASTAQAMASLVLCREALLRRGAIPQRRREEIDDSLARGREFLREQAADALWIARRDPGGAAGRGSLLFDIEKGLSFSGTRDAEGRPPYEAVALALLGSQRRDGRWSAGALAADDLVETAFAILALTRASEGLRAEPGPPLSPPADPEWPEEGAPPPATVVPAREARETIEWLEGLVRDPRTPADSLRRTLRFVGRALLRPDESLGDAWRERAEAAILRALEGPEGAFAARLLGATGSAVSHPLREALGRRLPAPVLREGFRTLALLGDEESLRWLCEENLSSDRAGPFFDRSREALRAVPLFRGMPGDLRRACAERIVLRTEGLEAAASPYASPPARFDPVARSRWVACRRLVLDALLALGRDPLTGAEPADQWGGRIVSVAAFRRWLGDHLDLKRSPWADR
jgi:hypothetical protein